MRVLGGGLLGLLLLVVAAQAYVRMAPVDSERWNRTAVQERHFLDGLGGAGWVLYGKGIGDWPQENGFEAVRAIDRPAEAVLTELDRIALATQRTRRIAGSVSEGMITYETRSLVWGFPDYTTVSVNENAAPVLQIYGRARFGRGDLGVNEARIRGWLAELGLAP